MQTLDAPVYEVKQDSEWYMAELKREKDTKEFFKSFKEKYGIVEGFSFYHSGYFGVRAGTEAYEAFKEEVLKNPTSDGFYPFRKRSKYFKEISILIDQVEDRHPFKAHDVLGRNNISASQWVGNRWFFGVKDEHHVEGSEVQPINYKDYLKVLMEALEKEI